jgi:hypothetical protein
MTGQAFYTFLYTWSHGVLGAVPVFQAYQNASPPVTGTYVAIEDDNDWQPYGLVDAVQDTLETDLNYSYVVRPVFWEVRGLGDSLRTLKESLETQTVKDLFSANGIGALRFSDQILSLPYLSTETQYTREHRWQPSFTVNNLSTDAVPSVATAQLVQTLGP